MTAQTNLPLTLLEEIDVIFENLLADLYADLDDDSAVEKNTKRARERILQLISERTNLVQ